jgi:hypothetical protein
MGNAYGDSLGVGWAVNVTFACGGAVRTLTPPDPYLKGAWCPGGFNPRTYQVKKPVSKCAFQTQHLHLQRGAATVVVGNLTAGNSKYVYVDGRGLSHAHNRPRVYASSQLFNANTV